MTDLAAGRGPVYSREREGLRIEERREDGVTTLALHGEVDLLAAPRLRMHLADVVRESDGGDVIVDLCDVSFIDSTGLAALLNALRRLTRAGRRLALVCPQGAVLRILQLTRLDSTFSVYDSRDAAVEGLKRRAAA